MDKYTRSLLIATVSISLLSSCATIIGGNTPTDKTTGTHYGPATIADGDTTLDSNRYSALTIRGNLTSTKLVISDDLKIESNATLTKVRVKDDTEIGGNLIAEDCTFEDTSKLGGNGNIKDSFFGNGLDFAGSQLELTERSKVIGNINSTNPNGATIIIDRSTVRGNISFAKESGTVIIRNKGNLKGQVINGTLKNEQ